ncbi:MAG: hypothetical protein QXQ64_08070 [Candidatus Bathyarchaeia archaeon]
MRDHKLKIYDHAKSCLSIFIMRNKFKIELYHFDDVVSKYLNPQAFYEMTKSPIFKEFCVNLGYNETALDNLISFIEKLPPEEFSKSYYLRQFIGVLEEIRVAGRNAEGTYDL